MRLGSPSTSPTRPQDGYFLMMAPLWLASAVTVPAVSPASAQQPPIPHLTGRHTRAALASSALVAPAQLRCA
ncbi:hypothetical protein ABZT04_25410 [Streptomyces sp. NPDC005492]|uniref:hypothetical protein n=1 Tax=Streptomyces sp. NPDC005492 TaxID=3156883 RepID=UPI0033B27578